MANPEEWTQTPNRASDGVPLWTLRIAAKASGPIAHIRTRMRVVSWAISLCSSVS